MNKQTVGKTGEQLAAQYLAQQGYQIIAANYRCRVGEIDLIVLDRRGQIIFVEVKTRRSLSFGNPAMAVDRRKQAKLRTAAAVFLAGYHCYQDRPVRFDVIEVVRSSAGGWRINHIPNAFMD